MTTTPDDIPEYAMPEPEEFSWKGPDGLTLGGRQWLPAQNVQQASCPPIPVVCLPGLSRNTRDFSDIARYLQAAGHSVTALDYRGRGLSEWDPDWRNYALPVEETDIAAAIEYLGLERFALLGTSRGGLHALSMANRYPANRMAAVILNDIGPHIEMSGLLRIAATLGRKMEYSSFDELATGFRKTLGAQFPSFSQPDWKKFAGQLASSRAGKVVLDFDPALACQLAALDNTTPAPDLWPLFEKLTDRPLLILRGAHSDLLSEETCKRMLEMHPAARYKIIPGQGHAPVLWEEDTQRAIAEFLQSL
ncbi:alpha/beta fold hydrolase [Roseibium sp.]|uniref:alpha/beta fold hydrolase n=1 Tax=Roseibium sp. TaxID=1936156 RepID=UPI003D0DEA4A